MIERVSGARNVRNITTCVALFLVAAPVVAVAQEKSEAPGPLAPLKACKAEADATARLACYDRVAAQLLSATEAGDLHVIDREEVKETRRSLFGFSMPTFGIFGRKEADESKGDDEINVLTTTIRSVANSNAGGYLITTAEGAVWRIDNPPSRMLSPKVGQPLEIRNAALSSYIIRVNGQIGVKGRRVN